MKYSELSRHIHELRNQTCGRAIGQGMQFADVWSAATKCPKNGVNEILYFEEYLPSPIIGKFIRLDNSETAITKVEIYVQKSLDSHWKEFIAIKELMHCWSPGDTWVGAPDLARPLLKALTTKQGPFTPNVAADYGAVHAACEVILPHYTVERHIALGHDCKEIAHQHNLHPDIVDLICRYDLLHIRKNGSL